MNQLKKIFIITIKKKWQKIWKCIFCLSVSAVACVGELSSVNRIMITSALIQYQLLNWIAEFVINIWIWI